MHKKHLLRTPLIAVVGLLAFLVVPSAAQAHHVTSTAKCELVGSVPTVKLDVTFVSFSSTKQVTGTISFDGVHQKDVVPGDITWNGNTGSLSWTKTTTGGEHTVNGGFTWPGKSSSQNGNAHHTVTCPTPPPPETPPTEPPPTVTPPTEPPPAETPPAVTTPPAVAPPSGGVLPETVASGLASLRGPSGCVKQAFKARVTGRSIASVAFFVDGKLVKKFTTQQSSYSIKVSPKRFGFGRHKVVARVEFTAASGTAARRLPLTFRRCAQGAVAPRFTG